MSTFVLSFVLLALVVSANQMNDENDDEIWFSHCKKSFECSGTNTTTQSLVTGSGYKSLYGSNTIISSHEVECDGAFACNDISSINASFVMCSGDNACSDSEHDIIGLNGVACYGANSCAYSSIVSEYELECGGSHSCAHSHINQSPSIYGKGAYSLYNAIINAEHVIGDSLDIYLYGYEAGYNTIILCDNKDVECNIYCYGNGCFKTKTVCLFNNCNVECSDPGVDCPTELDFDHNYDLNQLINYINSNEDRLLIDETRYMIVDSLHTSEHADRSCNEDNDSAKLDNFQAHTTMDPMFTDGAMCFRGSFTSNTANMRDLHSINRKKRSSNLQNAQNHKAKNYAKYLEKMKENFDSKHFGVTGSSGAWARIRQLMDWKNKHHNGNTVGDIVCSGTNSCHGSSMHLLNVNHFHRRLLCSGTGACGESDIYGHSQDIIYCSGENACEKSAIHSASVVYCDGNEACRASEIYGVAGIFRLNGFEVNGLLRESITAHEYSDYPSKIVSNGIRHMIVNLLSYKSGYNLDIYCNATDVCTINCGTNGACINTNVYCEGDCHISCPDTYHDCPIVYHKESEEEPTDLEDHLIAPETDDSDNLKIEDLPSPVPSQTLIPPELNTMDGVTTSKHNSINNDNNEGSSSLGSISDDISNSDSSTSISSTRSRMSRLNTNSVSDDSSDCQPLSGSNSSHHGRKKHKTNFLTRGDCSLNSYNTGACGGSLSAIKRNYSSFGHAHYKSLYTINNQTNNTINNQNNDTLLNEEATKTPEKREETEDLFLNFKDVTMHFDNEDSDGICVFCSIYSMFNSWYHAVWIAPLFVVNIVGLFVFINAKKDKNE